jgi:glycosyltransferase involved in cell wall biosynthesis
MDKKLIIVIPAYNAELTLEKTYRDIPYGFINEIILCNDESKDNTIKIARRLGLTVLIHDKNKGYGGNQKTLYKEALTGKPDIVVMLHADYQHEAKKFLILFSLYWTNGLMLFWVPEYLGRAH